MGVMKVGKDFVARESLKTPISWVWEQKARPSFWGS
jgi:hypothetical protein